MNQSQAQLRNAAARRLIARNRLREALDVLNEAIRFDPRWAESFENRATVFERMGMYPQAEADRRKVEELGGVAHPEPLEPPTAGAPPTTAGAPARPEPAVLPRYPMQPKKRGGTASAAFKALGTALIAIGLLVAAGIGIFIALNTLTDAINDDDPAVSGPTGSANGSGTPAPTEDGTTTDGATATPTPETPEEALQGSPLSFSRLQAGWLDKQFEVTTGGVSADVSGFKTTAVNVTLAREGSEMLVAVLLYDSPSDMTGDWNVGAQVTPKAGGTAPGDAFAWANLNAVVVVLQPNDALRDDARDAFLGLSS